MRILGTWIIAVLAMLPAHAQELHFGAAYWCPYSCSDKEMPGFVTEYLTWLFAKRGITLNVEVMPFSRAANSALAGSLDGLLTVMPREVPNLPMTTSPTMNQRNCFFTKADSKWKFLSTETLKNARIGVINNYAYGEEVDQYITETGQPNVLKLRDSMPEERLFSMLESDRIDTYLSDFYVQRWQYKILRKDKPKHRLATCLEDAPFYVGLSPKLPNYEELAAWVNKEVLKPENIKRRLEFEQRYQ